MRSPIRNVLNYALYAITLVIVASCSHDKGTTPKSSQFAYPLKVGNRWVYTGQSGLTNFHPDSLAGRLGYSFTLTSVVTVAESTALSGSLKVYALAESIIIVQTTGKIDTAVEISYFNNRDDGLYRYAYRERTHGGHATPLKVRTPVHDIRGFATLFIVDIGRSAKPAIDTIILENPPRRCLAYPFQKGYEWSYTTDFRVNKRYVGEEKISVTAGEFTCQKSQWLWDTENAGRWNNDYVYFDHISQIGLVRRSFTQQNMTITGETSSDPIGTCDFYMKGLLQKYESDS